jgi:hypothetical protein
MSDLDRDKLYTSTTDDPDSDDGDLELEPLDPELLAAAERRAAEAIDAHRKAIDINEVYRDLEANRDSEILSGWLARLGEFRPGRFQFQIKHLLILTAVLAFVLALRTALGVGFVTMLIIGFMLAVAGVSLFLKFEENKRQEQVQRRREKMYADRRAKQVADAAGTPAPMDWDAGDSNTVEKAHSTELPWPEFRFQISMSQLFMVTTGAALFLGLGRVVGGAEQIAAFCGLAALAGLVVPAFGLRPPSFVVFAWWMLLLVFVVLSLGTAIWTAFSAG